MEYHPADVAGMIARALAGAAAAAELAAEDLVSQAQDITPVDTGTLKASITHDGAEISGFSIQVRVYTGGESSEYAVYQHEGTSKGVPATKFLERPLLANKQLYQEIIAAGAAGAI